jgi:predicted cation transporter
MRRFHTTAGDRPLGDPGRSTTMKRLMRIHLYLSCLVAPAMIFFAVSGAWQAYRMQQTKKDGSYVAPPALESLSRAHMAEQLTDGGRPWARATQFAIAAVFVSTALVGIAMALQMARAQALRFKVYASLAAGVLVPLAVFVLTRRAS